MADIQRGRLLDAMAEVMAEEGYIATTVHMVLKRAGISRRTFYELFKDKEDCFLQTYQEAADHVIELVKQSCAEGGTPEERIENGLRAMLHFARREPATARVCIVEVMGAGQRARDRRSETMERLTGLVCEVLELRYAADEAQLRARVIVGAVHEMVYDALSRNRTRGLSRVAEEVVESYLAPGGTHSDAAAEAVHGR
ncbi:MAG: TetR/AcrR family transcriptional regulator [Solirubrobacterales bacterium]|nr:TetR/AcrR family transcriptional regulator [Solirubrobacterales bacterium]